MAFVLLPWQFYLVIISGWIHRQQQEFILRFASENPSWGYDRIQGALANVGYHLSDQTVGNVLKEHRIDPAPDRKRQTTWKTFIKSHWDVLAAIDFTTIEVWTTGGLVTYYLLFVMEVATRRVHLAGCTPNPDDSFFGESSLQKTIAQFLEHYHGERNHQGLANRIIVPGNDVGRTSGDIQCRERLGGLLRYYYRNAA